MKPASTASLSTSISARVDDLVLDQLEHRAARRERQRPHREHEVARDVDVGRPVADQRVQAEVGERAGAARRPSSPPGATGPSASCERPVQQLVRDDLPAGIEDRLPGDDDARGGDFRILEVDDHRGLAARIGPSGRFLNGILRR